MKMYNKTVDEALEFLRSSRSGLSAIEADHRLREYGANAVQISGTPLWRKIIEPFASVMMAVLVLAGILSLLQGNVIESSIVVAIMIISAVIDWLQQYSTERILRQLRRREADNVEVYRDGNTVAVSSSNIVPGDIIIFHEGQKVPADCRIIESNNLHVDESMLTGESLSVKKNPVALRGDKEVYDQANMAFSGSFVVAGSGLSVVTATGNRTEFGRMAKLAGGSIESPIQKKIDKLIRTVVIAVFSLGILVFLMELISGESVVESLQFVLAFSVSAVPESLPIAITVVLALGMRRMAEKKSLVRNMRAIENIGLVTTVASDKTGTITRNELRVQETWSPRFNDSAFALQASFALNSYHGKGGDPLDSAMAQYLHNHKIIDPAKATKAKLVHSLPFDYGLAMSGNVWHFGRQYESYIKGAPEKILSLGQVSALEEEQANSNLHSYAKKGYRVIAVAKLSSSEPYGSLSDIAEHKLEFLGLMAVADELRPRVDAAVSEVQRAGVKVIMITGDHSETAYNIAHQVGIADNVNQVYDSRKLLKLRPDKLAEVVETTRVYARVTPEAKYKILTELNKNQITAMTGDGVNDVPALTKSHVGIAMGSGSAIAKEASDVVLLDDNFRSIAVAIKEGRTIIANVRRMLVYLLATNAGEVLVTVGALLMGMPLPVLAVQILWINLATDTFLVIPLGVEKSDSDVMMHKPARPDDPILNKYHLGQMVVTALTMSIIVLSVFKISMNNYSGYSQGEDYARSAAFLTLIVIQWVNALLMRSNHSLWKILRTRNKAFYWALAGAIALQLIAIAYAPLRTSLHIDQIHADSIWACLIGALIVTIVLEFYKRHSPWRQLAD